VQLGDYAITLKMNLFSTFAQVLFLFDRQVKISKFAGINHEYLKASNPKLFGIAMPYNPSPISKESFLSLNTVYVLVEEKPPFYSIFNGTFRIIYA